MPTDKYKHYCVPIDCSKDARANAQQLARYFGGLPCKITLAAVISPAPDPEDRRKRMLHAWEALRDVAKVLNEYGIYTHNRVVEGEDHAVALASEASAADRFYDGIVMGAYQARPDLEELADQKGPWTGTLLDRICLRSTVPVLVLPFARN